MATEGQTERSHEEQAELWSCTTVQFALRVGQPEPPKVLFDASRSQPGLAAYYCPTDELILHPNLAVERPDLYCYEGLILHELGHRASPAPLRARRWIRLLLPAAVVLGLPGYIGSGRTEHQRHRAPRDDGRHRCRGYRSVDPFLACGVRRR